MAIKHCRIMFGYQSRFKRIVILLQVVLYATLIWLTFAHQRLIVSRLQQYFGAGTPIVCFGAAILLLVLAAMSVADKIQKHFVDAASAFYYTAGITLPNLLVIQGIYCFPDLALLGGIAGVLLGLIWDAAIVRITCFVLFPLLAFGGGHILNRWQASKRASGKPTNRTVFADRMIKRNALSAYAVRAFSSSQFLGFLIFYIITLGLGFMVRIPFVALCYGLATLSMLPAVALYEREEREAGFLCWMKISRRRMGTLIAAIVTLTVFLLLATAMLVWNIAARSSWLEGLLALCAGGISLALAQLLMYLLMAPLLPDRVSAPYTSPLLMLTMALSFIPLMKLCLVCVFLRRRKTLESRIV